MTDQTIDIQIFGRTIKINCPHQEQNALNKAVADLTQRLQDLKIKTKVTNLEQLIFIAALNISYELNQEKLKTVKYAANIRQQILTLQKNINQALLENDNMMSKQSDSTIESSTQNT